VIALLLAAAVQTPASAPPADFPPGYLVSVLLYEGKCRYAPTDYFQTAKQLTTTLRDYDKSYGVELLIHPGVPRRCVNAGSKVVRRAGFTRVIARPFTEADIGHGSLP
jgi:hypothetical protein